MINNEEEIWRVHPEYAGIEVSTLGRVRTLDRVVASKGNGTRLAKGHVLKQCDNGSGYLRVRFSINGKQIKKSVHRLVAQTFIPNPDNFPDVNHKDCNRTNNNVTNLEFCTASYNIHYREKFGDALGHHVLAISLSTLEVLHFRSQGEASRKLGVNQGNINSVIKGSRKHAGGFWFTNDDENVDDTINRKLQDIKKIYS